MEGSHLQAGFMGLSAPGATAGYTEVDLPGLQVGRSPVHGGALQSGRRSLRSAYQPLPDGGTCRSHADQVRRARRVVPVRRARRTATSPMAPRQPSSPSHRSSTRLDPQAPNRSQRTRQAQPIRSDAQRCSSRGAEACAGAPPWLRGAPHRLRPHKIRGGSRVAMAWDRGSVVCS